MSPFRLAPRMQLVAPSPTAEISNKVRALPGHLRIAYAVETERLRAVAAVVSAACSRLERERAA